MMPGGQFRTYLIYVACAFITCKVGEREVDPPVLKHLFVIRPLQGPSFLPTSKNSQVGKKNLSNIVAAKTIKVGSVLFMLFV